MAVSRSKGAVRLTWPGKGMRPTKTAAGGRLVTREVVYPCCYEPSGAACFPEVNSKGIEGPNRLIWGDNLAVTQTLISQGYAGQINLIYIDPPFFSQQDYTQRFRMRRRGSVSLPEQRFAFSDTWVGGLDSYLTMLYPRLVLMAELLRDDGNLWVHLDDQTAPYVKVLLDEIFGRENCINQVVWRRTTAHGDRKGCGRIHDTLLWYTKGPDYYFAQPEVPLRPEYIEQFYRFRDADGRRYRLVTFSAKGPGPPRRFGTQVLAPPPGRHWAWSQEKIDRAWQQGRIVISAGGAVHYKQYLDEHLSRPVQSIWDDAAVRYLSAHSRENTGFETQKPMGLLRRILKMCSRPGDLVADFFAGSGTTLVVAEELQRWWLGCEQGKTGIEVARARLAQASSQPFSIDELATSGRAVYASTGLRLWQINQRVLALYGAVPIDKGDVLGTKLSPDGGELVYVAQRGRPVSAEKVAKLVAQYNRSAESFKKVVVLGWDYELDYHLRLQELLTEFGGTAALPVESRHIAAHVWDEITQPNPRLSPDTSLAECFPLCARLVLGEPRLRQLNDHLVKIEISLVRYELPGSTAPSGLDLISYWAVDWDYNGSTFQSRWQGVGVFNRKAPGVPCVATGIVATKSKRTVAVRVCDLFGQETGSTVQLGS